MDNLFEIETVMACYMDLLKVWLVFRYILKCRVTERKFVRIICSVIVIPVLLITVFQYNVDIDLVSIFFIPIILCSFWIYMYKLNLKMILYYIITYLCICLIDVLGATILQLIIERSWSAFGLDVVSSLITMSVIVGIYFVCRKYNDKEGRMLPIHFIFLQLGILVVIVLIIGIAINLLEKTEDVFYERIFILFICILGILILSVGFILGNVIADNQRYKELEESNYRLFMAQVSHYEEIKQKNIEMQKYKHDFQSHIICLNHLLGQGNINESIKYVESMKMNLSYWEQKYQSGNDVIDAILNEQARISKIHNILFEVDGVLPSNINISNYDLCVIFSNILNNAVESAMMSSKEKYVKTKLGAFNGYISIVVKNSSEAKSDFKTTKSDKDNHGYGLLILRESVNRLNGDIKIANNGNEFITDVIIKENDIQEL